MYTAEFYHGITYQGTNPLNILNSKGQQIVRGRTCYDAENKRVGNFPSSLTCVLCAILIYVAFSSICLLLE